MDSKIKLKSTKVVPSLVFEKNLWDLGIQTVAGIDEVGRGAWAGPLSVGVAVVPFTKRVYGVRDSKMLNESQRQSLFPKISNWCLDWAVGHVSPKECDDLGMSKAQKLAASRALAQLKVPPEHVLIDGKWDFIGLGDDKTTKIIKGDAKCLSIAAASVLAKVTRDQIMINYHDEFPQYGFASNKGYPSPVHKNALKRWGMASIHRQSWSFAKDLSNYKFINAAIN